MKKILVGTSVALFLGCSAQRTPILPGEVPRQTMVSREDLRYGEAVLRQLSNQFPVSNDERDNRRVRHLVNKLASAARADDTPWHVYVLRGDNVKNAAATRGNYVFVWTGMLRYVRDDDELAVILAHEIGHVLANHAMPTPGEEANQMITGVAGAATQEIIAQQGPYGGAAILAGTLVTQALKGMIVNPEDQRKEYEADQIGLYLMADAGIDPENAVGFWSRVKDDPSFGANAPEFFSSHPSSENRMSSLRRLLDDARARYRRADLTRPQDDRFDVPLPNRNERRNRNFHDDFLKQAKSPAERLSVRSRYAPVYARADARSEQVDELRRGEETSVECREGEWMRVVSPTPGFVYAQDLDESRDPASLPQCMN